MSARPFLSPYLPSPEALALNSTDNCSLRGQGMAGPLNLWPIPQVV